MQSLLGPLLMTIILSYLMLETFNNMFNFFLSLSSFSIISTQFLDISCCVL